MAVIRILLGADQLRGELNPKPDSAVRRDGRGYDCGGTFTFTETSVESEKVCPVGGN